MAINSTFVFVMCGYICLVGATVYTEYKIIGSSDHVWTSTRCGVHAAGLDYLSARVTNTTCEPLTREMYEPEDISDEGVYIVKTKQTETVQETLSNTFQRNIPSYFGEGSELEAKFQPQSGWTRYQLNLRVDSENIALHTVLQQESSDLCFKTLINGIIGPSECYSVRYTVDAEYTIKIVCETDSFQIYMDGSHVGTFQYRLPVNTITLLGMHCTGAHHHMYQISFKTGQ